MINSPDSLILICVSLIFFFFVLFIKSGRRSDVISNDDMTLRSQHLMLVGRPDRIIKDTNGIWIPIEKKSALKVQESHRVQVGFYMILIEDITGQRPPHGLISLGDNTQVTIKNTAQLRKRSWEHINAVRAIKNAPHQNVKATAFAAKCRSCGYNETCTQAILRP